MPLLHLPVQSGSDVILRSMNRKHTIKDYFEIIDTLKEKNPKIKFASDFIIAYPGEKDDDFNKSCELSRYNQLFYCKKMVRQTDHNVFCRVHQFVPASCLVGGEYKSDK